MDEFHPPVNRLPEYVHPLPRGREELPAAFTYPFRYTAHPLCERAAAVVSEEVRRMGIGEGKMYGVLIAGDGDRLFFLAAYSGQLRGSYDHPWFVPPVVDYLNPDSHFQREQREIGELGLRMEAMQASEQRRTWQMRVAQLRAERETAVAEAKRAYGEGKKRRDEAKREKGERDAAWLQALVRESQRQKADIQRAKQLHKQEIIELESQLAQHNALVHELQEERRRRSEALQQWLFCQFNFLNGRGESRNLLDIFGTDSSHRGLTLIPSGAGECCAPKLLQAAYKLALRPMAMAEFWLGSSKPGHYRQPGAYFPACRSKCHPILGHMLQGLCVEPDPAAHYERALQPVSVLWEDEHLAVVSKPQGWVSIPGKSDQPCLLDAVQRLCPDAEGPIIVHRLDQDTSGVMVVAKNARIHHALSRMFELREVQKRYVALLECPHLERPQQFRLSIPLGPDLENLPRQRVDFEGGKEAITDCIVLGEERHCDVAVTRVAFYPHTGRTHQLRVHAASPEGLGTPILGDRLYGHVADRLYLHAEVLEFRHPATGQPMHFECPCPF